MAAQDAEAPASAGLRLDYVSVTSTYEFQHWRPRGIPQVFYETIGINLLEVNTEVALRGVPFIDSLAADFAFQWTPASTEGQEELIALRRSSATSWKQFAGNLEIGLPLSSNPRIAYALRSSYTEQHFLIAAQALKDYWYYSGGGVELLVPGDTISTSMTFRVLGIGPRLALLDEGAPSWQFGLDGAWLSFRKPYTHELLTTVPRTAIFSSTFEGWGCALWAEKLFYPYAAGLPFTFSARAMFGPASIDLDRVSAADILPEGAGMVLLDISARINVPFVQLYFFTLGIEADYSYRSFAILSGNGGEDQVDSANLNADHIFGVKAALNVRI